MNVHARGFAAALVTVTLLALGAAPAGAQSTAGIEFLRRAGHRPWSIGVAPAPCQDRAYRFLGAKWHRTYRWSFQASSTPSDLSAVAVESVLLKSFANLTGANNDCGRPDRIGARSRFMGVTELRPNCQEPDGHNVIGFGKLQFGVLAVTCYWIRNGRMIEADVKITSREEWALSRKRCRNKPMLESTITHEAGHVFGLDHIGERKHGRLTMSPFLDGPCENKEATLGLGDMLGLEALY